MAEFVQRLDPIKLVQVETALSFAVSAFDAPNYNLPIFLFGMYTQEVAEATESLKLFIYLLSASVLYDLIWMYNNHQNWFLKLITILTLALKIPTVLAFLSALRQRGAHLSGISFQGNDVGGGATAVWSMPGGFTSSGRDGYQSVDEPAEVQTPKPLGSTQPVPTTQPNAPGAYQNV
ncbi:uncharacterized protein LAESUDRAFT_705762 [Laetiporus sulphureus 93-53]|uniref:Uncharacterized protein n=1 Tax=Laetiporus sulphureus 93-53 TaxID=1314785 RepID=A0A165CFI6_9APHY|nr:uncharacterized protein LAESUDRAFT_705762 [Laetiporus sulphureus 93-53]KZT02718.1 hypothetical protein LAESUDRAFT_705762 [Laetiporus sulphureus 93-53]